MSDYIRKSALLKEFDPNGELLDPMQVRSKIVHCPTLDEKEIIRKAFERVVERLEESYTQWSDVYNSDCDRGFNNRSAMGMIAGVLEAIEIVKEECGISE